MVPARVRPSSLTLNGREFSYADIAAGIHLESSSKFEQVTLEFSRQWLSGSNSFELQTSGSTGKPKTIILSRKTLEISAVNTVKALGLGLGDRALICISTRYIGGKMMLVRGFETGLVMTAVEPRSNPFEEIFEELSFDFTSLVPLQLESILGSQTGYDRLNQMKCILVGGAPIAPKLEKVAQSIRAPIYATYGMTETASHVALRLINGKQRSDLFQVMEGIEISQDSRKCLQIGAPQLLDTPLVTNDMVELVGNNQFRWLGRADNVINSGGLKIHPETVEVDVYKVLEPEAFNRRFFLTGMEDPRLGERLVMIIEGPKLTDGEKAKMLDMLRGDLDKHHSPKDLFFVPQFLETANGKIKRQATASFIH